MRRLKTDAPSQDIWYSIIIESAVIEYTLFEKKWRPCLPILPVQKKKGSDVLIYTSLCPNSN